MPSMESRYLPVLNIIAGTVAGVLFANLVTTSLGGWSYLVFILATLGASSLIRDGWSAFHRVRLNRSCKKAYDKIAPVFKPGILDPRNPGNPRFMKEGAQRAVDDAAALMDRFGMGRPGNINVEDDASVEKWYEHLRPLRRQEY